MEHPERQERQLQLVHACEDVVWAIFGPAARRAFHLLAIDVDAARQRWECLPFAVAFTRGVFSPERSAQQFSVVRQSLPCMDLLRGKLYGHLPVTPSRPLVTRSGDVLPAMPSVYTPENYHIAGKWWLRCHIIVQHGLLWCADRRC